MRFWLCSVTFQPSWVHRSGVADSDLAGRAGSDGCRRWRCVRIAKEPTRHSQYPRVRITCARRSPGFRRQRSHRVPLITVATDSRGAPGPWGTRRLSKSARLPLITMLVLLSRSLASPESCSGIGSSDRSWRSRSGMQVRSRLRNRPATHAQSLRYASGSCSGRSGSAARL